MQGTLRAFLDHRVGGGREDNVSFYILLFYSLCTLHVKYIISNTFYNIFLISLSALDPTEA